jgi:hypothetical protein
MDDDRNPEVSNGIDIVGTEAYTRKPHVRWAQHLTASSCTRGSGFETRDNATQGLEELRTSGGSSTDDQVLSLNGDDNRTIISLAVRGSTLPPRARKTSIPPVAMDISESDDDLLGLSSTARRRAVMRVGACQ